MFAVGSRVTRSSVSWELAKTEQSPPIPRKNLQIKAHAVIFRARGAGRRGLWYSPFLARGSFVGTAWLLLLLGLPWACCRKDILFETKHKTTSKLTCGPLGQTGQEFVSPTHSGCSLTLLRLNRSFPCLSAHFDCIAGCQGMRVTGEGQVESRHILPLKHSTRECVSAPTRPRTTRLRPTPRPIYSRG